MSILEIAIQSLLRRFETSGVTADIQEAIRIHHQILSKRCKGHRKRNESLRELVVCLRNKFARQGITADLEEAISLSQTALNLCPPGHANWPDILSEHAVCLLWRFRSGHKLADADEAISHFQTLLDLRPSGHPKRHVTLSDLAFAFYDRFLSQRQIADLEKALSFSEQALNLFPRRHPDRATSLVSFALCLQLRSELLRTPGGHPQRSITLNNLANALASKGTEEALNEAVSLHRKVSELCQVDDPLRPLSLHNLALLLKSRFDLQDAIVDLNQAINIRWTLVQSHPYAVFGLSTYLDRLADCLEARHRCLHQFSDLQEAMKIRQKISELHVSRSLPYVANDHSHIKQVIAGIVQEELKLLPPRLLHTHDGFICDRAMQHSMFQDSPQYNKLVSLTTIQPNDIDDIRDQVAEYFRYAVLSHRWGGKEPLLEHVADRSIHKDLTSSPDEAMSTGFQKLRKFCEVARDHGFHWAWSDTCCINKKNNLIEVQEAIGSMFSWYQRSALMIIYLADISPNASPGDLSRSEWFRRGWTLQELLASCAALFYAEDWSLYLKGGCSDHKQNNDVLAALERTTNISLQYLKKFPPGMENARLQLQWASQRQTTYQEDVAYSLFGVFNVHLPVLYGEGREKAIGRLLQEIISQSGNTSVLDWTGTTSSYHSCFPADLSPYRFAPSVPLMSNAVLEQSVSRLRRLVGVEDAHRFHTKLRDLPFPQFANSRLHLPCILHCIQSIEFKHQTIDNYVYEVRASNLRPLVITSLNKLVESPPQKDPPQKEPPPYVLVRVLNQDLLETLKGDKDDAAYEIMAELDWPFSALLLEKISRRTYCRIASSHAIVACIDDSAGIASSEVTTLIVV